MNLLATLLAVFASCLSGYYFVTGIKSGQAEIFGKVSTGKIARQRNPGLYWATIAIWLVGILIGAYFAASWAIALAAA